jgi:microcystin-dependent protein
MFSEIHIKMINSQSTSAFATGLSIGTIILFGSDVIPNGWLSCNGSAISRTTYSPLFHVIGTLYGTGDHISTFNLPDFRGRFPLGLDGRLSQSSGFHQGGVSEITLTEAELPSHTHEKGTLSIVEAGGHTHTLEDPGHDHGGRTGDGPAGEGSRGTVSGGGFYDRTRHDHVIPRGLTGISVNAVGNHTHNVEGITASNGLGKTFQIMNPYQTINYIIYAGSSAATSAFSRKILLFEGFLSFLLFSYFSIFFK